MQNELYELAKLLFPDEAALRYSRSLESAHHCWLRVDVRVEFSYLLRCKLMSIARSSKVSLILRM